MPFFFFLCQSSRGRGGALPPLPQIWLVNAPTWTLWFRPAFSFCRVLGAFAAPSRFRRFFLSDVAPSFSLAEGYATSPDKRNRFAKISSRDYHFEESFRVPFFSQLAVWLVIWSPRPWSLKFAFFVRDMVTLSVGDIVWAFGLILHTTRLTKFLFPPSVAFHLLCCFLSWWPLGFWRCGCAASGTKKNQTGKKRNKSTLNSVPPLV